MHGRVCVCVCVYHVGADRAGHDRSIRMWDVASRRCVSEFTAHRRKYDEAIHAVRFHSSLPYLARSVFVSVYFASCGDPLVVVLML